MYKQMYYPYFSRKLGENVIESTVHSIKKVFVEELRKRRKSSDVDVLPLKKRGRPVLLGSELDSNIQQYL